MPKEITHFLIALESAKSLKQTLIGSSAYKMQNILKIGAIFPDIPYYLTGRSKYSKTAVSLAEKYHGLRGHDTYDLLKKLAISLFDISKPEYLSFLFGLCCHLQTDMTFHPFVYYWAGNYYSEKPELKNNAVRRHRLLEVYLDMHYSLNLKNKKDYKLLNICRNLELSPKELFVWISRNSHNNDLEIILERSLKRHIFAQSLFLNPLVSFIARIIEPFMSNENKELTALFYRKIDPEFYNNFQNKFEYKNPLTGHDHTDTLSDLFDRAVENSISLCKKIDSLLSTKNIDSFSDHGLSLNFNAVCDNINNAKYYYNKD